MAFTRNYLLGLAFLFLANVIWSGSSVLQQYIYEDLLFESSFFVTYIGSSIFILFLPLYEVPFIMKWKSEEERIKWDIFEGLGKLYEKHISPFFCCLTSFFRLCGINGNNNNNRHALLHSESSHHSDDTVRADKEDRSGFTTMAVAATHSPMQDHKHNIISPSLSPASHDAESNTNENGAYTHFDAFEVAMKLAPVWFLANLLYNYSLLLTSITSSTIISNLAASFTLAFAYYCKLEKVTIGKVFGIGMCFLGAVCVCLHDQSVLKDDNNLRMRKRMLLGNEDNRYSFWGDLAALISSIGYGFYTVVLRLHTSDEEDAAEKDDINNDDINDANSVMNDTESGDGANSNNRDDMVVTGARSLSKEHSPLRNGIIDANTTITSKPPSVPADGVANDTPPPQADIGEDEQAVPKAIPLNLILGYVGVIIFVTLLPVIIILAIVCGDNICTVNLTIMGYIILLAFFDNFVSEYMWARSILLTTPSVATVGMALTIPFAYVIDILIQAPGSGALLSGVGAVIVIIGFVFVNTEDQQWYDCYNSIFGAPSPSSSSVSSA